MTTHEMAYEFQMMLKSALPLYKDVEKPTSDEIMVILNIAYRRYIMNRYLSRDSNTNALTIQDMQDELYNLIGVVHTVATPVSNGELVGIGYTVEFPDDFYYYIRTAVAVSRVDEILVGDNSYVNVVLSNSFTTFERSKTTQFNEPILREPIAILKDNKMVFLVDKWTTVNSGNSVTVTYLKSPKNLGYVDSTTTTTIPEISDTVHEEVVKFAYEMWVNNITFANRVKPSTNDN